MRCDQDLLDVQGFHPFLESQPIDSIAITNQVAWRVSILESLNQLVGGPGGGRVFGHVKVLNLAAVMREDNEDEQDPEGGRRDGEEVVGSLRRAIVWCASPSTMVTIWSMPASLKCRRAMAARTASYSNVS